jgi:hypothetical protein
MKSSTASWNTLPLGTKWASGWYTIKWFLRLPANFSVWSSGMIGSKFPIKMQNRCLNSRIVERFALRVRQYEAARQMAKWNGGGSRYIRFSKPRITRTQILKAPKSPPFIIDLRVTTPNSSQKVSKRWETKPRKAKDKPLAQSNLRVAKAKQSTDADTKSRPGTQRCSHRAHSRGQSGPQRLHNPAPENVKTRSRQR